MLHFALSAGEAKVWRRKVAYSCAALMVEATLTSCSAYEAQQIESGGLTNGGASPEGDLCAGRSGLATKALTVSRCA